MEKVCLCCKEKIKGRSDKKFCGDACRNEFHNAQNASYNSLVRNTNRRLKKNYRILTEVNLVGGEGRITKSNLIYKGFFFDLFTSIYKTQKGNDYYFIYDLGYLKIAPDLFVVVQKFK